MRVFIVKIEISMQKTLHKKLTEKKYETFINARLKSQQNEWSIDIISQMKATLQAAADDLLQPREEAIARLLDLSRSMKS